MAGDDPLIIPVDPGEDGTMSAIPANMALALLHEQNMAQLGQVGVVAQANFVTVAKASDYDFLITKNQVTLAQSLGAREVAAEVSPGGPRKPST